METKQSHRIYRLVPSEQLERLIKTNFLLSKGLLLFEYLCSQSDEWRQFLYSAYDLLMLVYRINQRNLQNALRRTPRIVVGADEQKV